ncbi:unnamed protein product [Phaeothamnion confervicola]
MSDADSHPQELCAACIGGLGFFGNGVFQLAFAKILAARLGLRLTVPSSCTWIHLFEADGDSVLAVPLEKVYAMPIVADRVILSHPHFRRWAAEREPYRSLACRVGTAALSGRQLRRLFPQVSAAELDDDNGAGDENDDGTRVRLGHSALAGRALWGWFQFQTGRYVRHRDTFRRLFTVEKHLLSALHHALDACLVAWLCNHQGCRPTAETTAAATEAAKHSNDDDDPPRRRVRLVVVHLREGSDFSALQEPASANPRPSSSSWPQRVVGPPFEHGNNENWDDLSGCYFVSPRQWYAEWASQQLQHARRDRVDVLVWVCSDNAAVSATPAAALGLPDGTVLSWRCAAAAGAPTLAVAAAERVAAMAPGWMLDWWLMRQADALAVSNSSLSFSAAMLNDPAGAAFFRPDPAAGGLRSFDPWNDLPILPSKRVPANHAVHLRGFPSAAAF